MRQTLGKAGPLIDFLFDLGQNFFQVRIGSLGDQDVQGRYQRQPGSQQGRELSGHDRRIKGFDFSEQTGDRASRKEFFLFPGG